MNHSLRDTGMPIVAVTTRGARSGKLRKNPAMRVADSSAYAVVASKSGSDEHRASKSRRRLTRTNAGAATRQDRVFVASPNPVSIGLRSGPVLGPQEAVQPASDVVANLRDHVRVAQRSARASRAARRPASTAPSM
jgi:hypothetical protein